MRRLAAVLLVALLNLGAIAVTNRTSAYDNVDRTSYTTASVSIAAGSVVLVGATSSIASGTSPFICVSGLTLTWTESAMTAFSGTVRRIAVWEAFAASAQTGTITIAMGTTAGCGTAATSTGTAWSVEEVTGMDTSDPVLQPTTATGSASPFSVTLAACGDSNNRPYMYSAHRTNGATAPEAGGNWVELSDNNAASPSQGAEAEWNSVTCDTTCTATGGASNWGAVALELKIAGGAPPPALPRKMVISWDPAIGCEAGKQLALPIHHDIRWNVRRILGYDPCPTEQDPGGT